MQGGIKIEEEIVSSINLNGSDAHTHVQHSFCPGYYGDGEQGPITNGELVVLYLRYMNR